MKDPESRPKRVCSPRYAVSKARKGKTLNRWELEELAKCPDQSLLYAQKVLKGRFHEGEAAISRDPDLAFAYAKTVIGGRFEAAEDVFLNFNREWGNRNFLQRYFIDVARVPNPEIEKKILATHTGLASEYAEKCLGGRWHKAEPMILEHLDQAAEYHERVHKGRWPEFEDLILFGKKNGFWEKRTKALDKYLSVVGPVPEIEQKLERCGRASLLLVYAAKARRGRLPNTLHQKMMMFGFDPKRQAWTKKYVRFLESCERRALTYISGLDEDALAELLSKFLKK